MKNSCTHFFPSLQFEKLVVKSTQIFDILLKLKFVSALVNKKTTGRKGNSRQGIFFLLGCQRHQPKYHRTSSLDRQIKGSTFRHHPRWAASGWKYHLPKWLKNPIAEG
ncbi:hypothetical protein NPIL_214801 [Nephila pilipes]|uniref:Uncharacterized protein n=1 Tax=Nephila pilipes TaxID=299642 RepID=A0A8X6TEY9_NEPPI|nr:hypothetical protein NPIL_214801 [Nephila pilipes]